MNQVYKIKKAFRVPFIFVAALLFVLLALSFYSGPAWERILLAALGVLTTLLAIEINEREFVFSANGFRIKKFFRGKDFSWAEITHLGVVILRRKVYFLLTTTQGFYIFSNLLQDHALLVGSLAEKLGAEKVEPEVRKYLESPIERTSLVVLTIIALFIIVAIIIIKLLKL